MTRLPRWAADATRPTDAEVEAVLPPVADDARTGLARRVTEPRPGEVDRLLARRVAGRRRRVSPVWLAVPLAAALGLLTARQGLELVRSARSGVAPVEALMVGSPEELVPGVFVDGRGRARVDEDGAVALDGVYRLVTSIEVALRLGGARLVVEPGEVHVADGSLAVVRGTVRTPDGRYLVPGDTWTPAPAGPGPDLGATPASALAVPDGADGADGVAEAPSPPSAEVRRPVSAPPLALVAPTAPEDPVSPEGATEAPPAEPPPAEPPPAEPPPAAAPPAPPADEVDALADWRSLLDARDAGLDPAALVARLDAHARRWPDSPFAAEASALAALEASQRELPAAALARLEARLAAAPNGPRVGELHAAAARVARDGLAECALALPHDLWLANRGPRSGQPASQALAGLCELHLGRTASGTARLGRLDPTDLPPDLADAVIRALEAP